MCFPFNHASLSTFADHFSARAATYAAHRPDYPAELFERVAAVTERHGLAWDCATGNGQAAVGLAAHFGRVVATDASPEQIARARVHASVEYRVADAAASGLPDECADAVTVAQALHWLDVSSFYDEARRVLRARGSLVVWSYGEPTLDEPGLHAIVDRYNRDTLVDYWPPQRAAVGEGLLSVPFPFRELSVSRLTMRAEWTLAHLIGYLRSWSATARYVAETGRDPLDDIRRSLATCWGPPDTRHVVTWPLVVRAGRR